MNTIRNQLKGDNIMKLFTIGDSVSQGFMSAGAAKPQFSYNTLLAQLLNDDAYSYLTWKPEHHLKVDLELIFRELEDHYGTNIRGLEWLAALKRINSIMDEAEDYFERGEGKLGNPVDGTSDYFHNVAVEGMDVGDAWLVTPNLCRSVVEDMKNEEARKDNFFGSASDSFYRNAYRVLNPGGRDKDEQFGGYSALQWLEYHAKNEGIENTIVWLGANNALGTVIGLEIKQTPGKGEPLNTSRLKRQEWNLWHPDDFEAEYRQMIESVDSSMRSNRADNWNVFVGTVPFVTIAPVTRGVGKEEVITDVTGNKALYYQYYTYFPVTSVELALSTEQYLTMSEAQQIDETIYEFNQTIKEEVKRLNVEHGQDRYHIVDTGKALRDMAIKRNLGKPSYAFPKEVRQHYPKPNTKYYHCTRAGKVEAGGIFSLDGIHPSPTGQGLIAWEFLKVMKKASVVPDSAELDWKSILASDAFLKKPIKLMPEIYEHDSLISFVTGAIQLFREIKPLIKE